MDHDHHIYWATTTWFTSSFTHGDHAFEWTTPQRYEHQEPAGITLRETKIRDLSWGLWTSKSPFFDQNNYQFKEKGYSTYQLKWSSKKMVIENGIQYWPILDFSWKKNIELNYQKLALWKYLCSALGISARTWFTAQAQWVTGTHREQSKRAISPGRRLRCKLGRWLN